MLCTWIAAMAIHSPYFYTFRLETENGNVLCVTNSEPAFNHESTHTRFYTALLVTVLIVPLITVCILQTITLSKLRDDEMESLRTPIANKRHKKRKKMLLKMSLVIALAFALCWLLFIAFQFIHLLFPSSIANCSLGFRVFTQFAILFSLCHCIVNPCICFMPDSCWTKIHNWGEETREGNSLLTVLWHFLSSTWTRPPRRKRVNQNLNWKQYGLVAFFVTCT